MTNAGMTDTLPEPVASLIDAANAGDVEGFLAAFTESGVVDDWGRTFTGAAEIRGWSDREFIGKQVSLDVTAVTAESDHTSVSAQVGGSGFNGPSTFEFTTTDDRVQVMTIRA